MDPESLTPDAGICVDDNHALYRHRVELQTQADVAKARAAAAKWMHVTLYPPPEETSDKPLESFYLGLVFGFGLAWFTWFAWLQIRHHHGGCL